MYNSSDILEIRNNKFKQEGMCYWNSIDELPLLEEQKACVLERLTQEIKKSPLGKHISIWDWQKSYDPLTIDTEKKIALSYVMDMRNGGRSHPYENMKQISDAIFKEVSQEVFCSMYEMDWEGNVFDDKGTLLYKDN